MSPLALAYLMMAVSGALHAVVNAILKAGKDKLVGRALIDGSSALLMLPMIFVVPWPAGAWGWLAASAAAHLVYLFALVKAFESGDFSAAYPVARGVAPLVTAGVAIGLLGERASAVTVAGIAGIGGGLMAMGIGRHIGRASLSWSLLTGVMIAAYTVIDAHGVRAAPTAGSYIAWTFVLLGFSIGGVFAAIRGRGIVTVVKAQWKPGAAAGLLSIGTYGLALSAYRLGPTAPLAALRETGILVATGIAVFAFRESVSARRLAAIGAIAAGAMLVLMG